MVKCYLVGNIVITNADGYAQYQKLVPKTIADFGGRYLVRGGATTAIEGTCGSGRNVVLEFPSRAQAEAWYSSEAYQSIIRHRTDNSTGTLMMIDGYENS